MKKLIFLFGWGILFPALLSAQKAPAGISLQQCLQEAVKHFPVQKQLPLNRQQYDLEQQNLKKNYLPQLNLNGQASYQSDVTKVPMPPVPGFDLPVISKDWYKINFDLDQMIWDGGFTKNQQAVRLAGYRLADQQVKLKTFNLKKQVSVLYFKILFLQANIRALQVLVSDLDARIQEARAAVKNGVLLPADVDALEVNQKLAQQQIIEKKADQKGLLGSLNRLTHLHLTDARQLLTPQVSLPSYDFVNHRPEYEMMTLQQQKISAQQKLTAVKRLPVFKLFGQAGYGRPGYDMLNNNFDTYYMAGIRLHWNIYDWNRTKNQKQILRIQSDVLQTEKENFDQSLQAELEKLKSNILKFETLMKSDRDILRLQNKVVSAAGSKLKNGTITATAYLIELNKEVKAQLTLQAHKLQLVFAKYQYMTALGNL